MKLKESFTPEFFALNHLIASRKIELYEAQFELGDPNITEERKAELQARVDKLACGIAGWQVMMDLNQTHDANF